MLFVDDLALTVTRVESVLLLLSQLIFAISLAFSQKLDGQSASKPYLFTHPPSATLKTTNPVGFLFFFLSPIGRIHIHTYTHMLIGWKLLRSMININRWRCCWRRGAHESHIHLLLTFMYVALHLYIPLYDPSFRRFDLISALSSYLSLAKNTVITLGALFCWNSEHIG